MFFTGGVFNVYLDDSPDFAATFPGTGVTDGINFLQLIGKTGILGFDNPGTTFDETTTTLHSQINALTTPLTGTGNGYLEIVGGEYADLFSGIGAELFMQSDFAPPTLDRPGFGWPVVSEDPIVGNIVPEPSTIVLMIGGLFGLFIAGFRRKK